MGGAQVPPVDYLQQQQRQQQQQQQQQQYYHMLSGGQYGQSASQQPSTSQHSGQPSGQQQYLSDHSTGQAPSGGQTPTSHLSPSVPPEPQVGPSTSPAPLSCRLPDFMTDPTAAAAVSSMAGAGPLVGGTSDMSGVSAAGYEAGGMSGRRSVPADVRHSSRGGNSTSAGGGSTTAKRGRQPAVAPAVAAGVGSVGMGAGEGGAGALGGEGAGGGEGDAGAAPGGGSDGVATANMKALYHTESECGCHAGTGKWLGSGRESPHMFCESWDQVCISTRAPSYLVVCVQGYARFATSPFCERSTVLFLSIK
jgi:hypothetical protein